MKNARNAMLAFANALGSGDEDALATECECRLRELSYGSSLSFRIGYGHPVCWTQPASNAELPPYAKWGRNAAKALIQAHTDLSAQSHAPLVSTSDLGDDHPSIRLGCTDADMCPRVSATCGTAENPCPPLRDLGYPISTEAP